MMGLDINFREKEYRREKQVQMLVYAFAVIFLLLAINLYSDFLHLSSELAEQENLVLKLEEERTTLLAQREKLKPVAAEQPPPLVGYESFLGRYAGRAPDEVLYDLEKTIPEGVYITGFTYDRVTGVAVINAVSSSPDLVAKVLRTLETMSDYSQVMLTNQAEMEQKGRTKFVIKIVDNKKVDDDAK